MHTLHSPCTHPTWAPGWVCCRVTADHELCPVHLQTPPVCWCPRISHPEMSLLSSAAAQPEPLACAPPASWSLYGTRWPHATSSVSIFKAFFFFPFFLSPPSSHISSKSWSEQSGTPFSYCSRGGAWAASSSHGACGCWSRQAAPQGTKLPQEYVVE